ncbi:MAG: TRAP transporter substrate-binding protein DctP [Nitratireductor sp.]|nr:TRAP transporter substrate-binding protein DctP [Nitratireductor sp.]
MKFVTPTKIAGLALAAALMATASQAADKIVLKYADQFPLTHTGSKLSAQPFKKMIEERSNGAIEVQLYPAEQLAKAAGLLDAVKNRVADIAMVGVVYVTDKMPLTSAVELPGLFTDGVEGSAAFTKLAQNDLLNTEYLRNGVRPLFTMVTPPYQLMFAKKTEVNDISDLAGVKLRAAGATGELIAKALGAVPVRVPASDLYLALDRGTVDGAIYNPPSLFAYKIEEVLSAITTNASLGTVAFAAFVNEDVWKGLPEDARKMISEVSQEIGTNMAAKFAAATGGAYKKLDAAGIKLIELTPEVQAQFTEKLQAVEANWISQMESRGLDGKATLDAYKAYLAE